MDLQLSGKRALVTGSTAGIGFAIATELAREGVAVMLNGRDAARLAQAVQRLQALVPGADVRGTAADLCSAEGCDRVAQASAGVDILVNNFGIFDPQPFEAIGDGEWQRFFDANVMSGVRLTRALLPAMQAAGWGRVVFINSESGVNPPTEMLHYGMSKAAQLSVSRGLAQHCAGTGVTVNAVLPGPTRTEGVDAFLAKLAAEQGVDLAEAERSFFAQARPTSLLRRFVDPSDVAALVAYVCSPRSAATTGAALRVEGGILSSMC
ncbi:MAG: SDR family NAD(P)-dependent oxidoreductase [Proteobacteria bacterium]|nr:SDR family NAD(P)-dependent oxidoreductase [Pseudomonadota bacterium]